jgi:hypothetical protein
MVNTCYTILYEHWLLLLLMLLLQVVVVHTCLSTDDDKGKEKVCVEYELLLPNEQEELWRFDLLASGIGVVVRPS